MPARSTSGPPPSPAPARSLALRSVDRSMEQRRNAYEDEVRRLIDASSKLIGQTGCLEPRVGEIVAEAGLSNQAFYKHFRSKDELLLAVLDEGIRELASYLGHRMAKARSPERRIRQWISGLLEQALQPGAAVATRPFALSRARLAELFPAEVKASEQQLTEMLLEAIREAREVGDLGVVDPERDAELIYNLAMGWVERKLADPETTRRSEAAHLIEFAMNGLDRGDGPRERLRR
jgi:AcrR family transcriptional regulator